MKFSEYFTQWLYGENGYYSNYKTIGKEGDFFTAVSTSSFFGGSIGKKAVDTISSGFLPKDTTIVEIGAHHGYLLADMVQFIYTLQPELLKTLKFAIVERFEHIRESQRKYFQECFGDEVELIHYNDISEVKLDNAFVVANEIFDAFPCELVYTNDNGTLQMAEVKDDYIDFVDCDNSYIKSICQKYGIQKGEIGIGYEEFAKTLADNIKKFEFVTFDYGQNFARNDFSCRIYAKHNVYPIFQGRVESVSPSGNKDEKEEELDLKELFGKSDITYDVNFRHLIDSFKEVEVENLQYDTQLKALVDFGIIELLEILHKNVPEEVYIKEANKAKTLLEPTGMGERFKVAIFRKL
jgi:SAM-dependent MidA family methyltransferase